MAKHKIPINNFPNAKSQLLNRQPMPNNEETHNQPTDYSNPAMLIFTQSNPFHDEPPSLLSTVASNLTIPLRIVTSISSSAISCPACFCPSNTSCNLYRCPLFCSASDCNF